MGLDNEIWSGQAIEHLVERLRMWDRVNDRPIGHYCPHSAPNSAQLGMDGCQTYTVGTSGC
jgi:hypothetical protein